MEENTTIIKIPQDCEVEKIETQNGAIVVTFKQKERKLPKSWDDFCKMFPVEKKNSISMILAEYTTKQML